MARILVGDPYPEIRQLLAHIVSAAGFEPVLYDGESPEAVGHVDVLLLEPGLPAALEVARALRARNPTLPIVFVSIYPPTLETAELAPLAYLVKPFALATLQRTLVDAVARASVLA